MYNGENKTALLSQQMISDALLRLLEIESFAEISISTLCKEAQVSRQTFYSLFGTKENVVIYLLQTHFCYHPTEDQNICRSANFRNFCIGYSEYVIRNQGVLETLVRNDLMHYLYDVQYNCLMENTHFMQDIPQDERLFLVDFITGGMNSIVKNYMNCARRGDCDYLEKLMYRLFSGYYFIKLPD
ncbi:MAG TPA: TetR family transcriptional regulator [Ruminococcus sp.]|nr:TetR family transcriptional regulator [Ruminococcus sp.]